MLLASPHSPSRVRCAPRAAGATLVALVALAVLAGPARAATFTVNTTSDHAPNGCAAAPGDCTLREAITAADAAAGSTVVVPSGHYVVTSGLPTINASMDVNGAGAASTRVDANGNLMPNLFNVQSSATAMTVNIRDLTIEGVVNGADGAGLRFDNEIAGDALTLLRVTVRNNSTTVNGGGISTNGFGGSSTLSIVDSTIAGNHAPSGYGGGIVLAGVPNLVISGSTIANNTAFQFAAAIDIGEGVTSFATVAQIRNSTISGNVSANGSVIADGEMNPVLTFSYDTITDNTPGGTSAVLSRDVTHGWKFKGTIVSGNHGPNCHYATNPPAATQGFNFDSGTTCGLADTNDHQNTPVPLGPLQNNGGPTFTHALPADSPAKDAGGLGGCTTVDNMLTLATDQRGTPRPFGTSCDSGAFEYTPPPPPPPGGGGGNGGGGGGGGSHDTTAPTISHTFASPKAFAVDAKGHAEQVVAAAKRRKPQVHRGTKLHYTLSEAARVVFTVQRTALGRSVGHRCVKPTRKNRGAKRCTRSSTVGRFALASAAGANAHRFSGKVGRHALAPGSYRMLLVATDAAGNRSHAKQLTFTVVRVRSAGARSRA